MSIALRARPEYPRASRRPFVLPSQAGAALAALLVVYAAWQLSGWSPVSRSMIGDAFFYPVSLAATWTCWRAAQRCRAVGSCAARVAAVRLCRLCVSARRRGADRLRDARQQAVSVAGRRVLSQLLPVDARRDLLVPGAQAHLSRARAARRSTWQWSRWAALPPSSTSCSGPTAAPAGGERRQALCLDRLSGRRHGAPRWARLAAPAGIGSVVAARAAAPRRRARLLRRWPTSSTATCSYTGPTREATQSTRCGWSRSRSWRSQPRSSVVWTARSKSRLATNGSAGFLTQRSRLDSGCCCSPIDTTRCSPA